MDIINKSYHADNREIFPEIPDESIDLILTDPPYKDYQSQRPVLYPKQKPISESEFDLEFFLRESFRVLKDSGHFYCFTDHSKFPAIKNALDASGFRYKNCLVWVKNNHGSGDLKGDWAPQHEFIIFAVKGKGRHINRPRPSNVLKFPKVKNEKYSHGTVKPVSLLSKIVEASSEPGELVLDPYAGVMSTAIACIRSGRNYLMIEKDEDFFRRGFERIEAELSEKKSQAFSQSKT
ncbi:site-specific DNA-methyltransferase [bacterium]|nr:site-specific DNA-methyltransferase [FCB group bacterium]MBL7191214.1 site-specific DNA-methyltransferase [bacterium]